MRSRIWGTRRLVALILVCAALTVLSVKLMRRTVALDVSSHPWPAQSPSDALSSPPIPKLQGNWDLLWKDEQGLLLRTHCRIGQEGRVLTLWMSEPQLLHVDPKSPVKGMVERKTVSFQMTHRDGTSVMFVGAIDNGVIHGKNSQGLSWMAMKR